MNTGALSIPPKCPKFSKRGQMVWDFQGKVPENPEIVEFPKSEPIYRKFRDENQMERKCSRKICSKIWVYLTRFSSFSEIIQIRYFLFSAISFGRDHSELDILLGSLRIDDFRTTAPLAHLKPRPNDRNMPTQHIPTLLGATCCVRLATMLRRIGCCWLKFDHFQT